MFPGNQSFHDYFDHLLRDLSKLDGTDVKIVLNQYYETKLGIFDHIANGDKRPMSTVALYDAETNGHGTVLYGQIEAYIKSNIHKYTGLNLTQFLDLPREFVELITRLCMVQVEKENSVTGDIQKQLDKLKTDK